MEALTIVATVASIVQLSHVALTLSSTLLSLSCTLASAPEELITLSSDLETFSQSLTLLSRLLEDSRQWYSDDIYLLTAKIIHDCAELYGKIDKVLRKLEGGKRWLLRAKFVYEEGKIRKLMERLRDLKGTLATVLMSMQVDLQLSLLNISSASRIQREREKPLRFETMRNLEQARGLLNSTTYLPRYTAKAEETTALETKDLRGPDAKKYSQESSSSAEFIDMGEFLTQSRAGSWSTTGTSISSFVVFSSSDGALQALHEEVSSQKLTPEPKGITMSDIYDDLQIDSQLSESRLRRSTRSNESLRSAISLHPHNDTISSKTKSIQSVTYALLVASETLSSLFQKKFIVEANNFPAAEDLREILTEGQWQIERQHGQYCNKYGYSYIKAFTDSTLNDLQTVTSAILRTVVTPLHTHSAPHEALSNGFFSDLMKISNSLLNQTTELLRNITKTIPFDNLKRDNFFWVDESGSLQPSAGKILDPADFSGFTECKKAPASKDGKLQLSFIGKTFRCGPGGYSSPPPRNFNKERIEYMAEQDRRVKGIECQDPQSVTDEWRTGYAVEAAELTIPFIGYTFRRFDEWSPELLKPDTKTTISKLTGHTKLQESNNPLTLISSQLRQRIRPYKPQVDNSANEIASYKNTPSLWSSSLQSFQKSDSSDYACLILQLESVLDVDISEPDYHTSDDFCQDIADLIGGLRQPPSLKITIEEQIISVVLTVHEKLGLQLGGVSWACVFALLDTLIPLTPSSHAPSKSTLLEHLLEITSLIARYNVMENLYNITTPTLAIDAQYHEQLIKMCTAILQFFSLALSLATDLSSQKGQPGNTEDSRQAANGDSTVDLEEKKKLCEKFMEQIHYLDQQARGFRVVIDVEKETGQEDWSDESSSMEEEADLSKAEIVEKEWQELEHSKRTCGQSSLGLQSLC